ncbi:beta-1,6-galactanase [Plantactinospora sp. BC1]|uniref:beta-1,6-galactanase n=1 Tax=Plantactinospora sp. BC1 TaxID=2108470 RepID=UPI000D168BD5|nr:beta-1,6-galactanase [Plantactinospora sp. BC1]AVT31650.1 beta-1,6-galactanase [Plantactinospora sp. BC1]
MVTRRAVLGGAGAAAGAAATGGLLGAGTARADATISVTPGADFGAWEGWGTSLAWWANVFGNRDDFADIFFTTRSVAYNGVTLPGLGLTIARYNLGACSWNSVDDASMVASPNIPSFKQIEGFWQDWRNTDPASSAWNWNADANQRAALTKATQRGAVSELFANSPMWWMCLNHNPSGAAGGGNNLQSWNYAQHAYHLAVTARRARDSWGVTFRTVDPFNEPSSSWWTATGTQEGCHIDASIQRTVLAHLRTALDDQGLTGVAISASDETSYDLARTTWNSFDAATRAVVRQVNVHGYQGSGGRRDLLYNDVRAAGKVLWNSETGDSDGTGITMAKNLCLDWTWLHPTAWVYWQVMDPSAGWAAIAYDPTTHTPGAVQPKYHVLAQFTRHIRPGMRILNTGNGSAVAAYDAAARRLVVVAVNTGAAQTLTFDLSAFGTVTGGVTRWTTVPAGADRYTRRTDVRLSGKSVSLAFPAASVQTLEIDGVSP